MLTHSHYFSFKKRSAVVNPALTTWEMISPWEIKTKGRNTPATDTKTRNLFFSASFGHGAKCREATPGPPGLTFIHGICLLPYHQVHASVCCDEKVRQAQCNSRTRLSQECDLFALRVRVHVHEKDLNVPSTDSRQPEKLERIACPGLGDTKAPPFP